jgi:hypothetical protein
VRERVLVVAGLASLSACRVSSERFVATDAGLDFVEVMAAPGAPNNDLDILFVIDDSPRSDLLRSAFMLGVPGFMANLKTTTGLLPNVHIGVITPDMGATGTDDTSSGQTVGSGAGACLDRGRNGALRVGGASVTGTFVSDIREMSGIRTTNYTGSINDALVAMATVGSSGCEFEQPLAAARKALDGNPVNAGFLRASASLAVVFVTNEDDCSFRTSTFLTDPALGNQDSFRCTRYGVTCDYRGVSVVDMAEGGPKASCHAREGGLLADVADYVGFFQSLKKEEPRMVVVRNLAADAGSLAVEIRPTGPALQHNCALGIDGDPAVRLDQVADGLGGRRTLDACSLPGSTGYNDQMRTLALQLSGLTGRRCLEREVPADAECVVQSGEDIVPSCATVSDSCYTLEPPDVECPYGRITLAPERDLWLTMRCRLP